MTLPFFFLVDFANFTLPTLQCAAVIFALAAASFLPTTFGTMQAGGVCFCFQVAVTDLLPFIVTLDWPSPLQSPLQPPDVDWFGGWLSARLAAVAEGKEAGQAATQLLPLPVTGPGRATV